MKGWEAAESESQPISVTKLNIALEEMKISQFEWRFRKRRATSWREEDLC